mmetsp:Transcript_35994/g.86672  ORF Transcript_35994/g.86672 Transcript_35994/m.86672 type:complete len:212 (+) Transcript_35994:75-710(+)
MVEKDLGYCCLCIEIRKGCLLITILNFIVSLFCIVTLFVDDPRLLPQGYNLHTRRLSTYVGCFGLFASLIGLLGVLDGKPGWINAYNYYQYIFLGVTLFAFVSDVISLQNCEAWPFSLESQINFNPALERVASKGLCQYTREAYVCGFLIDWGMRAYFAYVTAWYYYALDAGPSQLIKFSSKFEANLPARYLGEPGQFLGQRDIKSVYGSA